MKRVFKTFSVLPVLPLYLREISVKMYGFSVPFFFYDFLQLKKKNFLTHRTVESILFT